MIPKHIRKRIAIRNSPLLLADINKVNFNDLINWEPGRIIRVEDLGQPLQVIPYKKFRRFYEHHRCHGRIQNP